MLSTFTFLLTFKSKFIFKFDFTFKFKSIVVSLFTCSSSSTNKFFFNTVSSNTNSSSSKSTRPLSLDVPFTNRFLLIFILLDVTIFSNTTNSPPTFTFLLINTLPVVTILFDTNNLLSKSTLPTNLLEPLTNKFLLIFILPEVTIFFNITNSPPTFTFLLINTLPIHTMLFDTFRFDFTFKFKSIIVSLFTCKFSSTNKSFLNNVLSDTNNLLSKSTRPTNSDVPLTNRFLFIFILEDVTIFFNTTNSPPIFTFLLINTLLVATILLDTFKFDFTFKFKSIVVFLFTCSSSSTNKSFLNTVLSNTNNLSSISKRPVSFETPFTSKFLLIFILPDVTIFFNTTNSPPTFTFLLINTLPVDTILFNTFKFDFIFKFKSIIVSLFTCKVSSTNKSFLNTVLSDTNNLLSKSTRPTNNDAPVTDRFLLIFILPDVTIFFNTTNSPSIFTFLLINTLDFAIKLSVILTLDFTFKFKSKFTFPFIFKLFSINTSFFNLVVSYTHKSSFI